MNEYLLGIDIGCGSSKVCIIDRDGNIIGYAMKEHEIMITHDNWSESNPLEYWHNVCSSIKEILNKSHIDPKKIMGISVSSAVPAFVMIDKNKDIINLAYNFLDKRASSEIEWLKENIGEETIFKISGFSVEEQLVLTSLLWERNNRPNDYKRIKKVLTPDGFITSKLTNREILNYSTATFFGIAFDIIKKEFNMALLNKINISTQILPDLYPCEEMIGEVTKKASEETGLAQGTKVIAGSVDAFAGWLGGGAINEGDIQINLGTAAVIGAITSSKNFIKDMWNCIYPVNSKNNYVIFGTTPTGGYLLRYFRDKFAKFEKAIEDITNINTYELLDIEAEKTPVGSDGLICLPFFMGARIPKYNRNAKGVLFGMTLSHEKGHIIRAMMEGVAFSLYNYFSIIKEHKYKINYPIALNEGGAKSKLWRKIFTDVFNTPTVLVKNRSGAPFGDAILAGVSLGILKDYSIAKKWAQYVDPIEPDLKNHNIYMEYFELYKKIYNNLENEFDALVKIKNKIKLDDK
jgi:ribulokinase